MWRGASENLQPLPLLWSKHNPARRDRAAAQPVTRASSSHHTLRAELRAWAGPGDAAGHGGPGHCVRLAVPGRAQQTQVMCSLYRALHVMYSLRAIPAMLCGAVDRLAQKGRDGRSLPPWGMCVVGGRPWQLVRPRCHATPSSDSCSTCMPCTSSRGKGSDEPRQVASSPRQAQNPTLTCPTFCAVSTHTGLSQTQERLCTASFPACQKMQSSP